MAASCPKCGAALVPGMRSCQFCGFAVEGTETLETESHPAIPPLEQTAPERPLLTPVLKPAASGASAGAPAAKNRKTRIFLYAATGAATLLGLALVFSMARANFAFSFFGDDNRSSGASTAQPQTPSSAAGGAELGIDVYPGASATSEKERSTSGDSTRVIQTFVSSDEMPKVINFYKSRMTGYASIYASGDGVAVSIQHGAQESTLVAISPARNGGKTQFTITHTTGTP